jgi:hypothetical protein
VDQHAAWSGAEDAAHSPSTRRFSSGPMQQGAHRIPAGPQARADGAVDDLAGPNIRDELMRGTL